MTHCPHCQASIAAVPVFTLEDVKAIRGKSTETEAQEQRILAALRTGPKSTDDLRKLGIYQTSARIFGLRKRGYVIDTELFNGYAADGYSHARLGRYTLRAEPLALDPSTSPQTAVGGAEGACT